MTIARRFVESDFDVLVARWHETNVASYPYVAEHQRHTLDDARRFFREQALARWEIWVAAEGDQLQATMAIADGWIHQLAVFPEFQRRGIGSLLLARARERFPAELRLFTFQLNTKARAFYEKHGFHIVRFGVSPAPESEPDVEYVWRAREHNPAPRSFE